MRPAGPRPDAPLPPSRQPTWYTVTWYLPFSSGRVSSNAVVIAAQPPPTIATRIGRSSPLASAADRTWDVAALGRRVALFVWRRFVCAIVLLSTLAVVE